MKTKRQIVKDRTTRYRAVIEVAVGQFTDYVENDTSLWFRPQNEITIQMLTALSEALGTDRINISCGQSGEAGFSEYTPGTEDRVGYIQVLLPIAVLI